MRSIGGVGPNNMGSRVLARRCRVGKGVMILERLADQATLSSFQKARPGDATHEREATADIPPTNA